MKLSIFQILRLAAKDGPQAEVLLNDILDFKTTKGVADGCDKGIKLLGDVKPIAGDIDALLAQAVQPNVDHVADCRAEMHKINLGGLFGQVLTFLQNNPALEQLLLGLLTGGLKAGA